MKIFLPYSYFTVIALLLVSSSLVAQCPAGSLTLSSQAQINAFPAGCPTIPGNLTISESSVGDIIDLTPLSDITLVEGRLLVFENSGLTTLSGLNNIATTDLSARISKNNSLTNLTGLGGLTSVNSFFQIDNNAGLTSVNGLNASMQINGQLIIENNDELLELDGLAGVTQIGSATLEVRGNPKLADISGLNNINTASILNLVIEDNSVLALCEVMVVCDYLEIPGSNASISGNAAGCTSRAEVEAACLAMPVTYRHFTVENRGKNNSLFWATETEVDNLGFHVEGSRDGIRWETLGFVPAGQFSGDYSFLHANPASGWHYYRLDQEDADGSRELSPVRSVYTDGVSEAITIYPNPASDQLTIRGGSADSVFDLRLFDLYGRLLKRTGGTAAFSVAGLAPGTYLLEVEGKNSVSRHRLVVRR